MSRDHYTDAELTNEHLHSLNKTALRIVTSLERIANAQEAIARLAVSADPKTAFGRLLEYTGKRGGG